MIYCQYLIIFLSATAAQCVRSLFVLAHFMYFMCSYHAAGIVHETTGKHSTVADLTVHPMAGTGGKANSTRSYYSHMDSTFTLSFVLQPHITIANVWQQPLTNMSQADQVVSP